LYSDANPKDTIRIKYATLQDTKDTIKKLEKIYKNGTKPHTRISKIANVLNQRLKVIDPKSNRYKLSNRYFEFLKKRTKLKNEKDRKNLIFKI
jgi:hypothetical protein